MPSPSKSTLMMPRSAQSSLSHWTTVRPGIDARSMGTTRFSIPSTNDHATRVLAKMTWQIVYSHAQFEILGNAGMTDIEARLIKMSRHRVICAAPLPVTNQTGEPRELLLIKAQCLSHFSRSRATTISNHVCCHGRAQ